MTYSEKEVKRIRNDYYRKWRSVNRDKVKDYNQRYWIHKAEKAQKMHSDSKEET